MRRNSGLAARLSDKIAAVVDAVSRGVERFVGEPKLQPHLVPVRVRDGRRIGIR